MLEISKLRNPIRNYPWGSRTAIAELLGRPAGYRLSGRAKLFRAEVPR